MAVRRKTSLPTRIADLHPAPDAVGVVGYLVQFWGERGGKGDGKKAEGKKGEGKKGGGKKPNVAEIESGEKPKEDDKYFKKVFKLFINANYH